MALVGLYTASALALVPLQDFGTAWGVISIALAGGLIAASVFDLDRMRLPDRLTVPLAVAGLVHAAWLGGSVPTAEIAGVVVGYLSLYAVAQGFRSWRGYPGLGLGDAKLFAAGGGWVGVWLLPQVMLIASVLALLAVVIARMRGAAVTRATRLAFGPFLALAIWLVWSAVAVGMVA